VVVLAVVEVDGPHAWVSEGVGEVLEGIRGGGAEDEFGVLEGLHEGGDEGGEGVGGGAEEGTNGGDCLAGLNEKSSSQVLQSRDDMGDECSQVFF